MVTNTAYLLRSLYSQKIFIINKQHHYLIFLPKKKRQCTLHQKHIAGPPGRADVLCHCVVRLQFLITVCYLNILVQKKFILHDMVYTLLLLNVSDRNHISLKP